MKRDKKFYVMLGLIVLVLLGLLILGVLYFLNREDKVVLKDNVVVITGETSEDYRPSKVGENELIFKKNPKYKIGDVIVSGATEEAPHGYIRRVVEIEEINGEYYYHTEYATFLDVFEEAHIKETIEIMVSEDTVKQIGEPELLVSNRDYLGGVLASSLFNVKESKDNENMDDLISVEFEGDVDEDVHIEGAVGIKVWLDFALDIEKGELEWGMTINARTHGEMLFGFSSSKDDDFEEELLKIMPPTFTIWAGPVPIVVTNEVTCQLEGEYEIAGDIGTQFEVESTINAGFIYTSKDNKVNEIVGKVMPSGGMEWDSSVGVEGKINGGVFVYLTTLLYDCSGAEIGVGLEGQASGEARLGLNKGFQGELELAIYPQLKGNIIVEIPILGEGLFEVPLFEKSLDPLWSEKWTNEVEEEVPETEFELEDGSKISFLLFEPGWECIGHAEELNPEEWWDEWIQSGKHFREQSAINDLDGDVDTSWILENYVFSSTIYEDGDDIEGLTVTYMEISDVKTSDTIDCALKVDPFSRWRTAFMNIYVDEQFVATIEIPGEIKIMNDYIWDVAKIENGKLKIINECTLVSEYGVEQEEVDHSGWKQLFSWIIEDTQSQMDEERIYFRELYFIEYPEEEYGGVSGGFSADITEFKYYLDYTNGKEYPELLFIGAEVDGQMKILAIYSYYGDGNTAGTEASVDNDYCPIIGICADNSIFCGYSWGDSYYSLDGEQVQGNRDYLIDPNDIPWKSFEEWN